MGRGSATDSSDDKIRNRMMVVMNMKISEEITNIKMKDLKFANLLISAVVASALL